MRIRNWRGRKLFRSTEKAVTPIQRTPACDEITQAGVFHLEQQEEI